MFRFKFDNRRCDKGDAISLVCQAVMFEVLSETVALHTVHLHATIY